MKRLLLLFAVLGMAALPASAAGSYFSPDVPTDDPGGSGIIFMPWDVAQYNAGAYAPAPVLSFPPNTAVDALHKMDKPGNWLFSVEAVTELPPGGGVFYTPDDVILYDGVIYTTYYSGGASGLPPGVNVDAVFLNRDDSGDLVLSFDVPTTIGAVTYEPADLVRYAGGAYSYFFHASAAGGGIATSNNVTGADAAPGLEILALDVPTDLTPTTGPTTYLSADVAQWDGTSYGVYVNLGGWPISTEVDAFSCQANPGRVYERNVYNLLITMAKSVLSPGNVIINWAPSCSSGAEEYGIYEGTLGTWYSHNQIICNDITGGPFDEDFIPMAVDTYYLVVPHNWTEEGAYGVDHDPTRVPPRIERPQAALPGNRCAVLRIVTPCP